MISAWKQQHYFIDINFVVITIISNIYKWVLHLHRCKESMGKIKLIIGIQLDQGMMDNLTVALCNVWTHDLLVYNTAHNICATVGEIGVKITLNIFHKMTTTVYIYIYIYICWYLHILSSQKLSTSWVSKIEWTSRVS